MRGYSIPVANASGSTAKTLGAVDNTTAVRARIFDVILGSGAVAPADQSALYTLSRFATSIATGGTTPTPLPVDVGDPAAAAIAIVGPSAEPTTYVDLVNLPLNQRASFRWVASPGYELVAAATSIAGIGLRLSTASTAMVESGTVIWFE